MRSLSTRASARRVIGLALTFATVSAFTPTEPSLCGCRRFHHPSNTALHIAGIEEVSNVVLPMIVMGLGAAGAKYYTEDEEYAKSQLKDIGKKAAPPPITVKTPEAIRSTGDQADDVLARTQEKVQAAGPTTASKPLNQLMRETGSTKKQQDEIQQRITERKQREQDKLAAIQMQNPILPDPSPVAQAKETLSAAAEKKGGKRQKLKRILKKVVMPWKKWDYIS